MFGYIIRRLLLAIPTLFGILLVTFIAVQFVPGEPIERVMSQIEQKQIKQIEQLR